jgi:phosphoribosylaminoimidazole (AIR) synthetase
MARVFNLGIGMVLVLPEADSFRALDLLRSYGHQARVIGRIEAGDRRVRFGPGQ